MEKKTKGLIRVNFRCCFWSTFVPVSGSSVRILRKKNVAITALKCVGGGRGVGISNSAIVNPFLTLLYYSILFCLLLFADYRK